MNTDEMKAGRELDAFVAEKVMGLRVENDSFLGSITYAEPDNPAAGWWSMPEYSTSIADAWLLAERFKLTLIPLLDGYYFAGRYDDDYLDTENGVIDGHFQRETFAVAETAPLAICLALLSAAKAGKLEKMD